MRPQYELERRFLVTDSAILDGHTGNVVVQAYLFSRNGYVIRVRRTHRPALVRRELTEEGPALLTAKGPRARGAREEYELEIPVGYAMELFKQTTRKISKTRYQIVDDEQLWDVDVFHGDNDGLLIAECEGHGLASLRIPVWCGKEVTDDSRYDNEALAELPYLHWPPEVV